MLSKPLSIRRLPSKALVATLSRRFSTVQRSKAEYKLEVGDEVHGFVVTRVENIDDFNLKAYHLQHKVTEAKFLHFDNDDKNNCFSVIFRTTPHDDKGTPHILEHLTCCGSEKYPVRDPFFKMIKRSLNTYMNAWTGPDFTCYPFSSANAKDFRNLMEVYMANTFSPLLRKSDFQQEGWRYDLEKETGQLVYKGVVFNEMKGVYQSSDNIFSDAVARNSFVESAYNHNYGGDPASITNLSYAEVRQFYEKFYHPTNARFFSYGNLDFTETLAYLESNYLSKFKKLENFDSSVQPSKRITEPRNIVIAGPPDPVASDQDKQVKMAVSFLCTDVVKNRLEATALEILSYLLCDTPSSPLYKALLESGIAPSFCPANGFETHYKEGLFNLGVAGIAETDVDRVEQIIFDTLREVKENGFEEEMLEGVLHQMEIRDKIPKENFGISLVQELMSPMVHDGDAVQALRVSENNSILRQKIINEKYLSTLIQKYLLDNKHRTRIVMLPDEDFLAKLNEQEKEKLAAATATLTEAQRSEIINDNLVLEQEQSNVTEDYSCLPSLEVADIDRTIEHTVFTETKYKQIPILSTKQSTNGLTFIRIQFDLERLPLAMRHYLELFTTFFTKIGTTTTKHDIFRQKLNLYTTNFQFSYHSANRIHTNDNEEVGPHNTAVLQIACIDRNIDKMFELLGELLTSPDFNDLKNVNTVLRSHSNDLSSSIIDSSMQYATSVASASLRENYFITERLRNTRFMCNYAKSFTSSPNRLYLDDMCFQMQMVMNFLMKQNKMKFIVHGNGGKSEEAAINCIHKLIDHITYVCPGFKMKSETMSFDEDYPNPFQKQYVNKFFTLPMQVNYCVQSIEMPHFTHPDTPALGVLGMIKGGYDILNEFLSAGGGAAELIGSSQLHREIREKGGAYGSGCQLKDGVMNFYSYRDPNTMQTIEAFARGVKAIADGNFTEENLKESKLSLFSKIDKIVNPQDKGLLYALEGVNDDTRRVHREGLIDSDRDTIVRVAREHVQKKIENRQLSKVIFGSELSNMEELKKNEFTIEEPVPGFGAQQQEENEE